MLQDRPAGQPATELLLRAPDVLEQVLDGETLLLAPGASEALHLDAVATAVWQVLTRPTSRDALAVRVAEQFGVEPARVAADVAPLLETLLAHRALQRVAA